MNQQEFDYIVIGGGVQAACSGFGSLIGRSKCKSRLLEAGGGARGLESAAFVPS